jgi:hypothetical protein
MTRLLGTENALRLSSLLHLGPKLYPLSISLYLFFAQVRHAHLTPKQSFLLEVRRGTLSNLSIASFSFRCPLASGIILAIE